MKIPKSNHCKYSKLTIRDIKDAMEKLEHKPNRSFKIYTGRVGMFLFDLAMRDVDYTGNYSIYTFYSKLNVLVFHWECKHGLYTTRININDDSKFKYHTYKGTELLFSSDKPTSAYKRLLKEGRITKDPVKYRGKRQPLKR